MNKEAQPATINLHIWYDRILLILPVIYILFVSIFMLWHRAWVSPDQFFAIAILSVVFIGRTKLFLKDWIPLLLLLFGYEYLRGLAPHLSGNPHILPMIAADNFLFGFNPIIKLQTVLFHENGLHLHWYDYLAVLLYISHFVVPMVFAFVCWIYDRRIFKEFTGALLVLSYMAFITFVIFPAAPPWMASNLGYLPPLKKIMDQVLGSFAHPIDVPSVYQFFGANLVAAVPSLHAAYPWLIFLFIAKKLRFFAVLALPYVFGVWFSVVYLGEHYVVDVIAGVLYATVGFAVVSFVKKKHNSVVLKGGERI